MLERIPMSELTERYFFCDPASGRNPQLKNSRARASIVGVAPHILKNGRRLLFVLVAWAARTSANALQEKILEVGEQWKPTMFGIESNALQSLFADLVIGEAKHRRLRLRLVPIEQPTKIDKTWRIRTSLQPEIANNNIYLLRQHTELATEIIGFPSASTMDLADGLASIVYHMLPRYSRRSSSELEREALAEHLRDAGYSSQEIVRRLGQPRI